jgi:hypothetical protein
MRENAASEGCAFYRLDADETSKKAEGSSPPSDQLVLNETVDG